jgi:hypothetical protein
MRSFISANGSKPDKGQCTGPGYTTISSKCPLAPGRTTASGATGAALSAAPRTGSDVPDRTPVLPPARVAATAPLATTTGRDDATGIKPVPGISRMVALTMRQVRFRCVNARRRWLVFVMRKEKQSENVLFEKRTKNFCFFGSAAHVEVGRLPKGVKVFCFFFSKKKVFLP